MKMLDVEKKNNKDKQKGSKRGSNRNQEKKSYPIDEEQRNKSSSFHNLT